MQIHKNPDWFEERRERKTGWDFGAKPKANRLSDEEEILV